MFKNIFIDEYQDINSAQRRLAAHWAAGGGTVFAIGDPDQSIYGFRGASAGCFDELQESLPDLRTIVLEKNYRSVRPIVEGAIKVINNNPGKSRCLDAVRGEGRRIRVVSAPDHNSEGMWIAGEIGKMTGGIDMNSAAEREDPRAFSDIAVLCRTRSQLSRIEAVLLREGVPCVTVGRGDGLYDEGTQGILGLFACAADHGGKAARERAINGLCKGSDRVFEHVCNVIRENIDKEKPAAILEKIHAMTGVRSKFLDGVAVFHRDMAAMLEILECGEESDIRRLSGADAASGAVTLMTLHASKGLEFPVVFLTGAEKGALPMERAGGGVDTQEERRLMFVGVTRARDELIITHSGAASDFIGELPGDILRERAVQKHKKPLFEQLSFL